MGRKKETGAEVECTRSHRWTERQRAERETNHNRKLDGETIHYRKGKGREGRWLHRSSQRYRTQMFWREVEAVTE